MAFQLNVSHELKALSKKLAHTIEHTSPPVFQPTYVITQTSGMNNWLKNDLAAQLGIVANYCFLKPNDLIFTVYFFLGGPAPSMLSTDQLSLLLYELLGEAEFGFRYPAISLYFAHGENKDAKRLALAEKTADLFDQYQIYRQDMIEQWNQLTFLPMPKSAAPDTPDSGTWAENTAWQSYLWHRAKKVSGDAMADKTSLSNYILQTLKNPEKVKRLLTNVQALHIFGLSITTAYHLSILEAISRFMPVNFYLLNPAPSVYWQEDLSERQAAILRRKFSQIDSINLGNTLLTGWGKVIRDTFSLLFTHEELINAYHELPVREGPNYSLLHKLQNDVFGNRTGQDRNDLVEADLTDRSVVLNSCFTVAREVEALYDYLVHVVVGTEGKNTEGIAATDIVVLVTDIEAYAPYIKAIFHQGPYSFPLTIADEPNTSSPGISSALKAIMQLDGNTFIAEDVLHLLDFDSIRTCFDLTNIALIRRMVERAGIRFGIEGSVEDETTYVSWKHGIRRIIYGICMADSEGYPVLGDTVFPLDEVEGSDSLEMIRFSHFVQVLIEFIQDRPRDRSLGAWTESIADLLHSMLATTTDEEEEDFYTITLALERLKGVGELIHGKIPYEIFCRNFVASLGDTPARSNFAGPGVTFCSLIPMRSVPFKVVAMLGMNGDTFPRKLSPLSFNLIELESRKGDRNIKDNDKHLMLETLLSAKEKFYISYIGQNARDNSPIAPSGLVDEFLDYIQDGIGNNISVRSLLVTAQPLHPFSVRFLAGQPGVFTYLQDGLAPGSEILRKQEKQPMIERESPGELSLEELTTFFKNPIKWYYQRSLGVYYREDEVLLPSSELFDLSPLAKTEMKGRIMAMTPDQLEAMRFQGVRTGKLPLKNWANLVIDQAQKEITPLYAQLQTLTQDQASTPLTISLPLGSIVIKGLITDVYGDKMVVLCYGKLSSKHVLPSVIRYLAARAEGHVLSLFILGSEKKKSSSAGTLLITTLSSEPLSQAKAAGLLRQFVQIFQNEHQTLYPFLPSLAFKRDIIRELDVKTLKKNLEAHLYPRIGKSYDPYTSNLYEQGYFNQGQIVSEFADHYDEIFSLLAEIFPGIYS